MNMSPKLICGLGETVLTGAGLFQHSHRSGLLGAAAGRPPQPVDGLVRARDTCFCSAVGPPSGRTLGDRIGGFACFRDWGLSTLGDRQTNDCLAAASIPGAARWPSRGLRLTKP